MNQSNPKDPMTLAIDVLSYGPYGIARHNGKAVMVAHTAPGDRVLARTVEARDRYEIAELIRVLEPSPQRQDAPCPYFPACGGCSWQHIHYDAQLKAKQQSVYDALQRIGKLRDFELRPIISSREDDHYRRRIRLQLDEHRNLGFYRAGSHDLIPIDRCFVADTRINKAIPAVFNWVKAIPLSLESIELVAGDRAEQLVVLAHGGPPLDFGVERECERLVREDTGITGLILITREQRKIWGESTISVFLPDDVCLLIEADVFTQINSKANLRLAYEVLNAGAFTKDDHVLELYSGAGNFTLPIAKRAGDVLAIEGSVQSVESGKRSARLNKVGNIQWLQRPVAKAVSQLSRGGKRFSKILLDPPRAGAKEIQRELANFRAEKILYVSCNPTTLARDIGALTGYGYKLEFVQPIDLFPHTFHVETLALITRR